jgi:hypothetical protein
MNSVFEPAGAVMRAGGVFLSTAQPADTFSCTRGIDTCEHSLVVTYWRAAIYCFRWHDLRYHFASRFVQAGVPLNTVASAAEPVELNFLWRPQLKDPADELMLEAAVNGRPAAIVTHNVTDFRSATERFGVATMSPTEFLKELAK